MAKLFERGGSTTPDLTKRVAWGGAGFPTANSTWQTVVTWLEGVLGFLKTTQNLNDLSSKSTARTNLEVYSKTEMDSALNSKNDNYAVNPSSGALRVDNNTTFIPANSYNPATKKYVDGLDGIEYVGDIGAPSYEVVTISFGETLNTANYFPQIAIYDSGSTNPSYEIILYHPIVHDLTTTSFKVTLREVNTVTQDLSILWHIDGKYRQV